MVHRRPAGRRLVPGEAAQPLQSGLRLDHERRDDRAGRLDRPEPRSTRRLDWPVRITPPDVSRRSSPGRRLPAAYSCHRHRGASARAGTPGSYPSRAVCPARSVPGGSARPARDAAWAAAAAGASRSGSARRHAADRECPPGADHRRHVGAAGVGDVLRCEPQARGRQMQEQRGVGEAGMKCRSPLSSRVRTG